MVGEKCTSAIVTRGTAVLVKRFGSQQDGPNAGFVRVEVVDNWSKRRFVGDRILEAVGSDWQNVFDL